jgi:hypothetical protein
MTAQLGMLARYFEPDFPVADCDFIGHGRRAAHYMGQYLKALVEGDQSKHPRVRFER